MENKETKTDRTIRVDKRFNDEIEDIKKERLKRLKDTNKTSSRKITSMIPKHKFWKRIKEEIIELPKSKFNKKGSIATANLFLFIILAFVVVLLFGTFLYCYNAITTSLLTAPVEVGAVNLTEATEKTMGQINTAMLKHANIVAIFFLFAMVLAMFLLAYLTRDENPSIFFVLDILIIIFAYILAVYISNSYETVLGSLPFSSIFTTNLNYATSFLLLLPKITLIVGVITMIIAYSAIPKTKEEEVAGF